MRYRGVNLGGWLVLERWMTPSLFEGTQAQDEAQFCEELGGEAAVKIDEHRRTFITESDLQWIKDAGLNAVRLPVPHWMFGDVLPYVGCVTYVDWLVEKCGELGLHVLLDVHTAPGSQNGNDHSGRTGAIEWADEDNIVATLKFIDNLTRRYGKYEQVLGFELLNEPHHTINHNQLLDYYKRGINLIRSQFPDKLVLLSDAYRPLDWSNAGFDEQPRVVLDVHLYQAFSRADTQLDIAGHVHKATTDWHHLIDKIEHTLPVVIGEWSLATGKDLSEDELTAYALAQLGNFKHAAGWFFWSYKTENNNPWNFRYLFEQGIISANLLQQ